MIKKLSHRLTMLIMPLRVATSNGLSLLNVLTAGLVLASFLWLRPFYPPFLEPTCSVYVALAFEPCDNEFQ